MSEIDPTEWKSALKSEKDFNQYIIKYFQTNKELVGDYGTTGYYEYYTVTLDSKDGLIISLQTSLNQQNDTGTMPFKDTEHISIEEFRQLILNKKFADKNETLTDVFTTLLGTDPTARFNKK
ncbi:MAG: hypothetical protein LKF36_03170 [Lactobacillus sp.]|jgi:hypothetical protein|nr:hypothetical protein [Lactobacillus sp.]